MVLVFYAAVVIALVIVTIIDDVGEEEVFNLVPFKQRVFETKPSTECLKV